MATNRREQTDRPATEPEATTVRDALDAVTDPELDRSIVELDYVDEVRIDTEDEREGEHETAVHVTFTLPTAWCSPAFAWMMATDAREVVEELSGVTRCTVELREHMHQTEINEGVNGGLDFADAFPDAEDGVASVRATLDEKARVARQYAAVEALLDAGLSGEQVATLGRDDVTIDGDHAVVYVQAGSVGVTVPAEPLERYRRKAAATDLFDDGSDRLFRTPEGEPIDPERFELVHKRGRLARVNMDGQGGVCDALHRARKNQPTG